MNRAKFTVLVAGLIAVGCVMVSLSHLSGTGWAGDAAGPQAHMGRGPAMLPIAAAASSFDAIWLWVLERQRELTLAMTNAVKRFKTDDFWAATMQLALVSFIYGVFHAAGPGHGKFIISSYALANAQTLRRGIAVSFMAALVQAVSAIVMVGVLALVLKATSLQMRRTEAWLETLSWFLVAAVGAMLLYRSVSAWRSGAAIVASHDHAHEHHHHGHSHAHAHDHGHGHHHADTHGHGHTAGHTRAHAHAHASSNDVCPDCGHIHTATPAQLEGAWSWREAWSIALAIGVRPCTGAIAVLLFGLGIGLFSAGVFAAFAMAFGTALTVSALAVLAVTSRDLASRLAGERSIMGGRVLSSAAVLGSALVFGMGAAFFVASLQQSGPL